ncbi:hypothetical protein HYFRA_00002530 [Hymenoscyphus fraxineus]|uniref:Uncharacterized protein n=1 Tax=Hymenoscyphus fraxineus TaxID=746836 RepID=A0A9N9L9I3_9HELO|nr:hypothetical protein HYFRA_00002530 [Hymenoscyphus fraxineus]
MTGGNLATGRGKPRSFIPWCGKLARSGGFRALPVLLTDRRPVQPIGFIQALNLATVTSITAPDQIVFGIAVQVRSSYNITTKMSLL